MHERRRRPPRRRTRRRRSDRSIPARSASTSASDRATLSPWSSELTASFIVAPRAQRRRGGRSAWRSASSTGRARSRAAASPPTMIVSSPASAKPHAARDRCVEQGRPPGARSPAPHRPHGGRRDRAHLEHDGVPADAATEPAVAGVDLGHRGVVGQAGDHDAPRRRPHLATEPAPPRQPRAAVGRQPRPWPAVRFHTDEREPGPVERSRPSPRPSARRPGHRHPASHVAHRSSVPAVDPEVDRVDRRVLQQEDDRRRRCRPWSPAGRSAPGRARLRAPPAAWPPSTGCRRRCPGGWR